MSPSDYDDFAEAYSSDNDANLMNAHYERPAMLRLAGDVAGRRILDAGCGSGPLTLELRARGAEVAGFDASAEMIRLARGRLGDNADLRVADLAERLPYEDDAFDDAVCSLALHYLEEWEPPLRELRRVLRPGGRLLVSVEHPFVHKLVTPEIDYFSTAPWPLEHELRGRPIVLNVWHRPLHAMVRDFTASGFHVAGVDEPPVAPDTPAELLPEGLGGRTRFLGFLFFELVAVEGAGDGRGAAGGARRAPDARGDGPSGRSPAPT
ncbi:class I SAM-dependent methyltransferase [Nocardiopsis sp. NPDC006938]|uniref:class I SAM-dependent methyltransferase n=1 Tax=Nocardiopsis sp. NPDC006938 TaxID=3364337 RepID=UPI0036C30E2C